MTVQGLTQLDANLVANIKAILKFVKQYKQFPKDWVSKTQFPEFDKGFLPVKTKSRIKIRYSRFNPNAYTIDTSDLSVITFGRIPKLIKKEIPYVLSVWDVDIKIGEDRYIFKTEEFV